MTNLQRYSVNQIDFYMGEVFIKSFNQYFGQLGATDKTSALLTQFKLLRLYSFYALVNEIFVTWLFLNQ